MAIARRPSRHNPEAPRLTFVAELKHCLGCGEPLSSTGSTAHSAKTVQTLNGEFYVVAYSRRCWTPGCIHFGKHYHASGHLQVSLPYSTYGLDVVAYVGIQRELYHRQLVEITSDLNEHEKVKINDKSVGRLYRQFLALVSGAWPKRQARLRLAAEQFGGLVLLTDGLAPDGDGPQLYVMWEALSGTPISGMLLDKADAPHITDWMKQAAELLESLPVRATMCDGQDALLIGLKTVWSGAEHGLCQSHYLNNLAKPVEEDDRVLRQALKEHLTRLAGVPTLTSEEAKSRIAPLLAVPEATSSSDETPSPVANETGSRFANLLFTQSDDAAEHVDRAGAVHLEQYYGYYRQAVRDALTRPIRKPFQLGGLQGHDQLVGINQSLLSRRERWGTDAYLDDLQQRVQAAIQATETRAESVRQAKDCLVEVECCLNRVPLPQLNARPEQLVPSPSRSQEVKQTLDQIFSDLAQKPDRSPTVRRLLEKRQRMEKDWLPGILHCYDVPGLPRHNLKLEGLFGTLRRHERRVSGRKETSPLRTFGPGELMLLSLEENEILPWLQSVPAETYWAERRKQEEREERRRWLRRLRQNPAQALSQVDQQFYAVIKEQARASPDTS